MSDTGACHILVLRFPLACMVYKTKPMAGKYNKYNYDYEQWLIINSISEFGNLQNPDSILAIKMEVL